METPLKGKQSPAAIFNAAEPQPSGSASRLNKLARFPVNNQLALALVIFAVAGALSIIGPIAAKSRVEAYLLAARPTINTGKVLGLNTQTSSTQVGAYFWAGSLTGIPGNQMIGQGQILADGLGLNVIRITLSPTSDMDYQGSPNCISNFNLAGLADREDFRSIIADPQFTTVIITAYDGVTFKDCKTKNYMNPAFFTAANAKKIQTEYTNLANYLKQYNKTFIIDNWEADNDIYCGNAFGATPGSCPGTENKIAGYVKWEQARIAGVKAAGAAYVKTAFQFNNIHSLETQNMASALNDIAPQVDPDYFDYSSYESINVSPALTAADIDYIRQKLSAYGKDPGSLFFGEMGFDSTVIGEDAGAAELTGILNVVREKDLPYAIIWNLIDNPSFGIYDTNGLLTVYGQAAIASPAPAKHAPLIAGVQGYNADTNQYTNGYGYDDQYLILYGDFPPVGNTIYVEGVPFTPLYESETQINVKLDNTVLPPNSPDPTVQISVTDSTTQTDSPPVEFQLKDSEAIMESYGYSTASGQYVKASAVDNGYLILHGNFLPKGNTVYVNGIAFTPIYQNSIEAVVKLDNTKIKGSAQGTNIRAYVKNGSISTPSVNITLYAAPPSSPQQ